MEKKRTWCLLNIVSNYNKKTNTYGCKTVHNNNNGKLKIYQIIVAKEIICTIYLMYNHKSDHWTYVESS